MNALPLATILLSAAFATAQNQGPAPAAADQPTAVLNVYGPGGPLPAMKDAATTVGRKYRIQVNVIGGPPPSWLPKAMQDADLIFSGSEDMMSNLEMAMRGALDPSTIRPLYLRKAAILVRPGNPDHIKGLNDLLQPGHHILVVNGAGQQGLWEDIAARHGRSQQRRRARRLDQGHLTGRVAHLDDLAGVQSNLSRSGPYRREFADLSRCRCWFDHERKNPMGGTAIPELSAVIRRRKNLLSLGLGCGEVIV
jgi:hypothetical protein